MTGTLSPESLYEALRPTFDDNGASSLVAVGRESAPTDPSGKYVLSDLAPDIYVVSVDPATGRGARRFATVYYPDVTDWHSAGPVDLSRPSAQTSESSPINVSRRPSSSSASVDVTIPWKKMVQVSGSISNAASPGAPVSSFYVSSTNDPSTTLWRVSNSASDVREKFRLDGITPGTYDVFPTFGGPGEQQRVAHVRLTVSRDLQGATIEILPGVEVLGQIHIRFFDASSSPDTTKLKVGLRARKGELVSPPPVSVQSDGSFVIPNVAEMEYQLVVTGLPDDAYIESAKFDGADALNSWFKVSRFSQRLQIVLDTAGGEIDGRLLNIHRESFRYSASIVLVPMQRAGDLPAPGFVITPPSQLGTFTVHAVPPGDYRLLAWTNPNGHPYLNEEFMKAYLGMGDVVHVYRGSRIQADAIVVDTR